MVLTFPIAKGDLCLACGQLMKGHPTQCVRDAVVGQDQHAIARRLRLARMQTRPLKVGVVRHRVEGVN